MPAPIHAPRRTLVKAAAALLSVVLFGTVGTMIVEGWGIVDALFFTMITLTTIGYSDYELSVAGRVFAMILIVGGLAVVTHSAGQLLPPIFNRQLIWERKMNRQISQLQDHFIVCGLGRIGLALCQHLARAGVPFIAIDDDPERVALLVEVDLLGIVGDAMDDHVLAEAGLGRARALAAVTSSDSNNIVITLTARHQNPDLMIVSRAEREDAIQKLNRAGACRVISPIRTGGISIANAIMKPNLAAFLEQADDRHSDYELAELTITEGSSLAGSTFDAQTVEHDNVSLVALKHDDATTFRPAPQQVFNAGDVLIVAGDTMSIDRMRRCASERAAA